MNTRIRLCLMLVVLGSLATALGVSRAVATETAPASAEPAAGGHPSDSATAAARCRRGYRRVNGRCRSPKRIFRNALVGSRFDRAYSSSNYASSGTERYDFCNGTYSYYAEHFTEYSSSTTSDEGSWRILKARVNKARTAGQARVRYQSAEGGGPDTVVITIVGEHQAYLGDTEYHRTANAARWC